MFVGLMGIGAVNPTNDQMKTETKIAEENIKELIRTSKDKDLEAAPLYWRGLSSFHKASCQRFLEFLLFLLACNISERLRKEIQKKITDLENAIKKYEENGI